ncbi:MAG: Crp/Fnr family transcriptional regulator [Chitinophaga sp.]|uniref:Crp/Fnr family transcriptional regulator n=1 Tax=Chitinophaga sp. TaxID=1869181 RepID=UPI001B11E0FC|nr:cyclic nucleotide-binding domain-containing protein [Chitinophaga sp.]MBO9729619.1 Crp/Fnr family transcriptional regulator [Chitinophaga sp.]
MTVSKIKNIITGIRRHYDVSDASITRLTANLEECNYTRGHLLTRPGIRDYYIYFIEEGCTRTYLPVNGKEVTNWFSCEGDITFSSTSFYYKQPAYEFVEVLENARIYIISIEKLEKLFETDIELANWGRVIHQDVLFKMQTLRLDRLNLTAQERYDKFCLENPTLLNRVNLGYIASFLGITQQYLSNLRGQARF